MKKKRNSEVRLKDRLFNAGYGIGASIVILGALFKLMYWEGANEMLIIGMVTEAIIFALSAFERPLKSYEWDKIFDFESGRLGNGWQANSMIQQMPDGTSSGQMQNSQFSATPQTPSSQPEFAGEVQARVAPSAIQVEGLSDADAQKLNASIQNLARTAEQLNEIASFSLETERFAASIQQISQSTSKYAENQSSLIEATQQLQEAYQRIGADTENIEINTKEYRNRVERINSNLAGMNSIYEIQLKDIHAQSVHFHNQTEISKKMSDEMQMVTGEISKLKNVSDDFSTATRQLKTNANELAENIAKLNAIYGNMLNAMN